MKSTQYVVMALLSLGLPQLTLCLRCNCDPAVSKVVEKKLKGKAIKDSATSPMCGTDNKCDISNDLMDIVGAMGYKPVCASLPEHGHKQTCLISKFTSSCDTDSLSKMEFCACNNKDLCDPRPEEYRTSGSTDAGTEDEEVECAADEEEVEPVKTRKKRFLKKLKKKAKKAKNKISSEAKKATKSASKIAKKPGNAVQKTVNTASNKVKGTVKQVKGTVDRTKEIIKQAKELSKDADLTQLINPKKFSRKCICNPMVSAVVEPALKKNALTNKAPTPMCGEDLTCDIGPYLKDLVKVGGYKPVCAAIPEAGYLQTCYVSTKTKGCFTDPNSKKDVCVCDKDMCVPDRMKGDEKSEEKSDTSSKDEPKVESPKPKKKCRPKKTQETDEKSEVEEAKTKSKKDKKGGSDKKDKSNKTDTGRKSKKDKKGGSDKKDESNKTDTGRKSKKDKKGGSDKKDESNKTDTGRKSKNSESTSSAGSTLEKASKIFATIACSLALAQFR